MPTPSPAELKAYKQTLQRAARTKRPERLLPALHEAAFARHDCLACARCCSGGSPRFTGGDIERLAKRQGMRQSVFIETYLKIDADGDYVMAQPPCAFLQPDNRCAVYDIRPRDCARFPYTEEDVLLKRPALTLKNATFCPMVQDVLEGLAKQVNNE